MIKINGHLIEQKTFTDNTLKCSSADINQFVSSNAYVVEILWCYDSDNELFTLISILDYIKDYFPEKRYDLYLPYVPNARQDRYVADKLFTLKSFTNIINSMNFHNVFILDPHSDVASALINRCRQLSIQFNYDNYDAIVFPDTTAAKKYFTDEKKIIIANKHRNNNGEIDYFSIGTIDKSIKNVIIRDDICATGKTIINVASELRKNGIEHIDLYVSHLENTVHNSNIFEYIDRIFTTDSIYTLNDSHVTFLKKYRN